MNNILKGTASIWATTDYKVEDVLSYLKIGKTKYNGDLEAHSFATLAPDSDGISGWTKVGMAEISIQFYSPAEIQGLTVDALKKEIASVQAEAQNKITELTRKLNEVLAITMESQNVD